ncbi:(2Fe-2S)-binding protein [Umboniibacter marinipuniceus]|uniref:Bacterioferritin-associated ferredoxin n=1 Tax=Umboniibacter marinipuniceus TaxID=569599 RepID=A0A3M0AB50_9GAMM|nr:(2Fe-2S)-binding protein [Umboniibacter marinipuniceus]RMA79998.1 bacterioferritin-associated ferredoxin [Umboniibacter marinipuniceus]
MFVCVCAGITQQQINNAVTRGARTVDQLRSQLNVASGCGMCLEDVTEQLSHHSTHTAAEFTDAAASC